MRKIEESHGDRADPPAVNAPPATASMRIFAGRAVAPGFAAGKAVLFGPGHRRRVARRKIDPARTEEEIRRFEAALRDSIRDTENLQTKVRSEIGDSESLIFEAHLAMLRDSRFAGEVRNRIREHQVTAACAIDAVIKALMEKLSKVKDEFLRERSEDIRDVGRRVLDHLDGARGDHSSSLRHLPERTILIARELLPSDTIAFDREKVIGFVTEQGGAQSHRAILARSMGIPAVTGVAGATSAIREGEWVLVDGMRGRVIASPTERQSAVFARSRHVREDVETSELREESIACRTQDGLEVALFGNIGRVEEAAAVREHYLSGVGLFRTEFLYLDTAVRPSLKTQFLAYKEVVDLLEGVPATIRTLDLGGDKHPAFLDTIAQGNASLGLRGLQFSLAEEGLLRTQLRAILRASRFGPVRLMFPMVRGEEDLRRVKPLVDEAAAAEGLKKPPPLGAMIETPAAVFQIDEILQVVDFVSIGTNDLTQFILAADRDSVEMMEEHSVLHPAVLRAIRQVVTAADARGKEVSVCGEAAGDPATACLLIGLGVRNLSMSPVRAAKVRSAIRRRRAQQLEEDAEQCLSSAGAADVKVIISNYGAE